MFPLLLDIFKLNYVFISFVYMRRTRSARLCIYSALILIACFQELYRLTVFIIFFVMYCTYISISFMYKYSGRNLFFAMERQWYGGEELRQ